MVTKRTASLKGIERVKDTLGEANRKLEGNISSAEDLIERARVHTSKLATALKGPALFN